MKRKKGNKVLFVFLIILTIILIPLINFHLIVYNEKLYNEEFAKLNIYDNFEDKKYPDRALSEIIDYFKSNIENPQIEGFNERENSHMRDVKILINGIIAFEIFLVFLWVVLYLILSRTTSPRLMERVHICKNTWFLSMLKNFLNQESKELTPPVQNLWKIFDIFKKNLIYQFGKIMSYGNGILIILILFFMIVSIFAFDFIFLLFHRIFFIQGNWAFPPDSNMISLFPSQFFQDIFLKIIVNTGISAVVLFIVGFLIVRFKKNNFI